MSVAYQFCKFLLAEETLRRIMIFGDSGMGDMAETIEEISNITTWAKMGNHVSQSIIRIM
jgi:hypothetical protein